MNMSSSVSKHTTLAYQRAQRKEQYKDKYQSKLDRNINKCSQFFEANKSILDVISEILSLNLSAKDRQFAISVKEYFEEYMMISQKQKDALTAVYLTYALDKRS